MRVLRPTPERFDQVLELLQASDAAAWGGTDWTVSELREEWDDLELDRDAWLVELDGRLAGVAHLVERNGSRFLGDAYVHPELTGRGVGNRLLDLVEGRARELEADWPDRERIVLDAGHLVGDERAPALFRGRGFEHVRSFFRMVVDVPTAPPEPAWPAGVELRPLDVELHGPQVHAANQEAFAAEWGHTPRPYAEWAERTFERPRFDPSLVPVAWAGDEIAGFAINYPKRMGDWGWVGSLGVRSAWRRQGLGLALLHESFLRFRATGETTVALGVDTENPTGATRLYERAGMRVLWQADIWQKELRAAAGPAAVRSATIGG